MDSVSDPTCRACYAASLTQAKRDRFYAEPITSCVYLCPEHQRLEYYLNNAIDWSKVTVQRDRPTRVTPPEKGK